MTMTNLIILRRTNLFKQLEVSSMTSQKAREAAKTPDAEAFSPTYEKDELVNPEITIDQAMHEAVKESPHILDIFGSSKWRR
jgi:hypothetical protein